MIIFVGCKEPNHMDMISIDRINNNINYVPGNIKIICKECNLRKYNAVTSERLNLIKYMENKVEVQNNIIRKISEEELDIVYKRKQRHAGKKNKEFCITKEYVKFLLEVFDKCPCCGIQMQNENNKLDTYINFDRRDNSIGYTNDNTHLICRRCNNQKRDSTIEDQLKFIEYEKRYFKE